LAFPNTQIPINVYDEENLQIATNKEGVGTNLSISKQETYIEKKNLVLDKLFTTFTMSIPMIKQEIKSYMAKLHNMLASQTQRRQIERI